MIEVLEPEQSVLVALQDTRHQNRLAQRAWDVRPESAYAFASAHLELAAENARDWFFLAPAGYIPRLFDLVKDFDAVDAPSWVYEWVVNRISNGRKAADEMWRWCSNYQ